MNLLELKHVTLQRGGRILFTGFSKVVAPGRITVIMGPNGTGKSSLLLALAGMIQASGRIALQGKPLNEHSRPEIARQIAWQGDLPPTEFGLTVAQRLRLAAGEKKIEEQAEMMEVDCFLDRSLGELSSGERQRVELTALMLRDVSLWLLDEPTAHLDLRHQVMWLKMLRRQSGQGRAIVVVLHDIQQAMSIADDVVLIDGNGNIETDRAVTMLTQERLQAVFGVPLHASSLLPEYWETEHEIAR